MLGLGTEIIKPNNLHSLYSVALDGTDDYISLPTSVKRTTGTFSIWFKTTVQTMQTLVGFGEDGVALTKFGNLIIGNNLTDGFNNEVLTFNIKYPGTAANDTNVKIQFAVCATAAGSGTNYLRDGNWHNVVYACGTSGVGNKFYIDGSKLAISSVASDSAGGGATGEDNKIHYQHNDEDVTSQFLSVPTLDKIALGRRFVSSSPVPFSGNIDEFAIWSSVLSDDNVEAIYSEGNPFDLTEDRIATGTIPAYDASGTLVNYWRMNEFTSSTSTTATASAGSEVGTLTSGASFHAHTPGSSG